MNLQLKKALFVFVPATALFFLLRSGIIRKPKTTKEETKADLQKNAGIVATAYGKALKAGESPEGLEELNKATEQKYGLRVYRKHSDGKYYVADTKGNDVLKIT